MAGGALGLYLHLRGSCFHEFREHRPFQTPAQFRREIGKYVDDEELARLERYVTVEPR